MRVVLSVAAEEDLTESFAIGIETFGLQQAESYLAGLKRVFDLLSTFPRMARERAEFQPPELRVHHHERHYIAYLIREDHVLIVRVVRDDADLDRLFGKLGR